MRILIVEDEVNLAEAVSEILHSQKYQTDIAYNGKDGLEYALMYDYDCIILDVMLPEMDGFQVVKKLREAKKQTPVIMLTAKDDVNDKIMGLDKGADDYMTKPFIPEELLARIRANARRQGEVVIHELEFGDIKLNLSTAHLSCVQKDIRLGFKEFEIMKLLLINQKSILSKETLIDKVWGNESDAEDNNVEAYISFLRKKLKYLGSNVGIISLRRLGYQLHDNAESED